MITKLSVCLLMVTVFCSSCVSTSEPADLVMHDADPLETRYRLAFDHQKAKRYSQAAVVYLGLPVDYPKYGLALYSAGNCYYSLSGDENSSARSVQGGVGEQETEQFFEQLRTRLQSDMPSLPTNLFNGIDEDHWPAIDDPTIDGQLSNWHKCLYVFKKYVLSKAQREWAEIKHEFKANQSADYIDAISVLAKHYAGNAQLKELKRLGRAVYKLAYLMRYPPKSVAPEEKTALTEQFRDQSVRLTLPFWSLFGQCFEDDENYKKGSLKMSFYALLECGELEKAEGVYESFREFYPDEKREIRVMVVKLYNLVEQTGKPKARALIRAAGALKARANSMKRDMFLRIPAAQVKWKNRLIGAVGLAATHDVLADYFWQVWVKEYIFGETDKPNERSKLRKAEADKYYSELLAEMTEWWVCTRLTYKLRWAFGVEKAYSRAIKNPKFAAIKNQLDKAMKGQKQDELFDILTAEIDQFSQPNKNLGLILLSLITSDSDKYRYFVGIIFIHELAEYFEQKASELEELANPITARSLKYHQLWRTLKEDPPQLSAKELKNLAKQYFRIGDWDNTIKYWQEYADRFGKAKWGEVESVEIDMISSPKTAGTISSNEELQVRYQLGRAHLERYKIGKNTADLVNASLQLRRCQNYNLIRDTIEIVRLKVKIRFIKSLEKYYLEINSSMAECYFQLHLADIRMNWPKYKDQYNKQLKPENFQFSPNSATDFLYEVVMTRKRSWMGFRLLTNYQFRTEYQENYLEWLRLIVLWKKRYGEKTIPVRMFHPVDSKELARIAYIDSVSELENTGDALDERTKEYAKRLKVLSKQLRP